MLIDIRDDREQKKALHAEGLGQKSISEFLTWNDDRERPPEIQDSNNTQPLRTMRTESSHLKNSGMRSSWS
jgi:hypothetical protein